MNSRIFPVIALFVFAIGFVQNNSSAQTNIIQIVGDDLGWVDLSTGQTNFGNGSPYHQTPNIDLLAFLSERVTDGE